MAMAKVFVWSLCLFTLLSAFHSGTCNALSLRTCTSDSYACTCMRQVTDPVQVDTGENFTTTMSIKFRTITMDELYSNVSKISLVRYDKDIITGFRIDDPYYSGRWTPSYSFEPSSTGCVEVKVTVSVHGAALKDDGKYHWEVRTENMTYTTRGQPLTVYVNPVDEGQQTNVTSAEFKDEGKYHLEATTRTMDYTTRALIVHFNEEQQTNVTSAETNGETRDQKIKCDQACIANMQDNLDKLNDNFDKLSDNLTNNHNMLHKDLLRRLPPEIYGLLLATFFFSLCAVMLLAVLLVLKIRSRRHDYEAVSTPINNSINIAHTTNILQVEPRPGLELGDLHVSKPNATNGNAVETDSAA